MTRGDFASALTRNALETRPSPAAAAASAAANRFAYTLSPAADPRRVCTEGDVGEKTPFRAVAGGESANGGLGK